MTYAVVLPAVYPPYLADCLATSKLENVLVIDNSEHNIGVPASWNKGIDHMKELGADWLIIMSAAVRFGEPGGLDFVELLKPGYYVVHAAGLLGWHLTAFHKDVFDNIGRFDQNFYPAYLEDIDFSLRLQKHYKGQPGWDSFPIDATDMGRAHGLKLGNVAWVQRDGIMYFMDKWGRDPKDYKNMGYDLPFNNPENTLAYWPDARGGRWND